MKKWYAIFSDKQNRQMDGEKGSEGMVLQRLDKLLGAQRIGTRREIGTMARRGLITVNGVVVRDAATKVDPSAVTITVSGKPLKLRDGRYYMLHKPAGVVTATQDNFQKTVLDLFPENERDGLFPVGRLDKDTEGLLLLTDDGDLAHALTAPGRHVDKLYLARVSGALCGDAVERFAGEMVLADGSVCKPAVLELLGQTEEGLTEVLVTLREGKHHQVKRMIAACGGHVAYLKRLQMGALALDESLAPGAWRELTPDEVALLRR